MVEKADTKITMKATGKRIVDRYPHLQDSAGLREMLVRNAVGSARVEGIEVDEKRLRDAMDAATETKGKSLL